MYAEFVNASRTYLTGHYLPKIERCVEQLTDAQLWWRPNAHCNSIGNLILHLSGNIRQYVVSGVGGAPDVRERDAEFAAEDGAPGAALIEHLRGTLEEVDQVLARIDQRTLFARRKIQGQEMSAFEAIYHAVEHFSMHTGQILYISKELLDRDLGFYAFDGAGGFERRW